MPFLPPNVKLHDLAVWGQDRLWAVQEAETRQ
jgi:hypothetical protein